MVEGGLSAVVNVIAGWMWATLGSCDDGCCRITWFCVCLG